MEEYLGLLLTITEGLHFPKKKLFLSIRYSRYSITFPVVSGGDTTVFNQGYFFRNVKVEGHDESDLPVLIQAYEKKSLFKSILLAELRVEAFNFYSYDLYEPLYFCLKPIEKYKSYECQLKVMFQLVKPSSIFVTSKSIDNSTMKPIAYQFDISSASFNEELVDKKLYFSCQMNINSTTFIKTRDVKGNSPQWNLKQIISVCDFANQNELLFTVFTVVHPHQQSTVKTLGEARIPFKKVLTSLQPQFELPILLKKQEFGMLQLSIRPIYATSRDGTANPERIFQLQPNMFSLQMNNVVNSALTPPTVASMSQILSTMSSEHGTSSPPSISQPVHREGSVASYVSSLRDNTVKSESLSQVTQRQLQLLEENEKPVVPFNSNSLRESIFGDFTNTMMEQSPRDSITPSHEATSVISDVRSNPLTEIKKAHNPSPVIRKTVDLSSVYIPDCTAIVRKNDSSRVQGLRIINRVKHDYVEALSYVL